MFSVEPVLVAVRRNCLPWLGHVLRKDNSDWVEGVMTVEVKRVRDR